ncbi:MAG: LysR family transcriptional regulator substrate-binding protein [Oscillospiraceae bacterium]|nr:LysR family transcriptional regulator substrate-binding protein [Oscillospiraceae bacterium]
MHGEKIDLAILAYYPTQNLARAKIIPAGTESLGVILSIEDPLAASTSLPLKALAERTFFRVDNDYFFCAWRHISSLCRAAGFTPKGPALFNQMEALMMAIRRGDGVTILGQHMQEHLSEELVFVPLEGDEAQREICLIYNQENENQSIELFSRLYLEHVNAGDIPLLRHI